MLYYSIVIYLLLEELKGISFKESFVLSFFGEVLAPEDSCCYNSTMKFLTILSGRRPADPCDMTTMKSLSIPDLTDGSSSIVSCPSRTNMRVTDILRLLRTFRKERSYVNWY
jgi:hypothetical protein